MIRKSLILLCFIVLAAAESVYFARDCMGGLFRLGAERAFYRNDHRSAWTLYHKALAWGGNRATIEIDLVELTLFGLDQLEAGSKIDLPLPPEESIPLADKLIARRLRETPYKAYCWSLNSDVSLQEARQQRRAAVLDLTTLSENPAENLLPEERRALESLEIASRLEPMNYIYQDLLIDLYTNFGQPQKAAEACRRAVQAFPEVNTHRYLVAPDLPPDMLEAAVAGFEDALRGDSLVSRVEILSEAGKLLAWHGHDARAEPYFLKALEIDPNHFDSLMEIGLLRLRRKDYAHAVEALGRASIVSPEDPWPDYYSGITHMEWGQIDRAVVDFQSSREKGADDTQVFHKLGAALEARGRIKEAERQFAAAANLHPEVAEAWSVLLEFHLRHRNIRAAEEACSRLSRLNGGQGVSSDVCASLGRDLQ
jgi:tetratricopeptide (TPR) repeat protein